METISETAFRLYKLHQQRQKLTADFAEADRVYYAGDGDDASMKTRVDAGDALNLSIAAGAELRRLAARHPGYFRKGWRESPDMIPEPLTDDERLTALKLRADAAKTKEAEREKARQAERQATRDENKKRSEEIRDDRRKAAAAAGQISLDEQENKKSTGRKK